MLESFFVDAPVDECICCRTLAALYRACNGSESNETHCDGEPGWLAADFHKSSTRYSLATVDHDVYASIRRKTTVHPLPSSTGSENRQVSANGVGLVALNMAYVFCVART